MPKTYSTYEAKARLSELLDLGVCAAENFGALRFDMRLDFFSLMLAFVECCDRRVATLARRPVWQKTPEYRRFCKAFCRADSECARVT